MEFEIAGAVSWVDLKLKGPFGFLIGDFERLLEGEDDVLTGDLPLTGDLALIGAPIWGTYFRLVTDDLFPGTFPPGMYSEDEESLSKP